MPDAHVSSGAKIVRNPRTASRTLGGKCVVVVIDHRTIHTLNAVGARIWELAGVERTLDAITETILREFDVSEQTARADVEAFVQTLHRAGAINVVEMRA